MPKAVIFDVDGTLVDSVDLHAQGWVDALKEFGHEIEFEDVRRQIGKGGDQLLPVFLSKKELSEEGKAIEERRSQLFSDRYLPRVKVFPEVRALFERLVEDGKLLVLASSAKGDERHSWLTVAGAYLYFWARVVYVPLYAFDVTMVRTVAFVASAVGIVMILIALT